MNQITIKIICKSKILLHFKQCLCQCQANVKNFLQRLHPPCGIMSLTMLMYDSTLFASAVHTVYAFLRALLEMFFVYHLQYGNH